MRNVLDNTPDQDDVGRYIQIGPGDTDAAPLPEGIARLPGDEIDFRGIANPAVVLEWDMQDLVELYDHGTPADPTDDLVTFSLSDPFPARIVVREEVIPSIGSIPDTSPPGEVAFPAIGGATSLNAIQWVNPIDEDFDHVVVVRKAGAEPNSHADGEQVYNGYAPNYFDATGASGVHCYYLVYTVDLAGNESVGVVLDQVQH
jgi:hypothetical protein